VSEINSEGTLLAWQRRREREMEGADSPTRRHRKSLPRPSTLPQRIQRSNLRTVRGLRSTYDELFNSLPRMEEGKTHPHPAPDSLPEFQGRARPTHRRRQHLFTSSDKGRGKGKGKDAPDPTHVAGYTTSSSTLTSSVPHPLLHRAALHRRWTMSGSVRHRHLFLPKISS
jgi:hypothetical protein